MGSGRIPDRRPSVRIRPARPRDFPACARVCIRALRDLSRRSGQPPPPLRAANLIAFYRHAIRTDPKGFQVAFLRGKVVCYAITILRGKTHFLAQFFAIPGRQGRGIGRPVLARAFDEPRPPRGAVRCVVASHDLRAQVLYVKFGMLPRTILYFVEGKPPKKALPTGIELRQVGPTSQVTTRARVLAARFDRLLREVRRDADQRYFFTVVKGTRLYEAREAGKIVGYVVIRGNGAIGPGGVLHPAQSGDLMAAALAKAREIGHKTVVCWIPGLNEGALRAAFAAGLKVDFLTTWMAARDIVDLSRYIPSGGVLF